MNRKSTRFFAECSARCSDVNPDVTMNEIALRLAAKIFDQPLIANQYRSAFIEAMIEPYLAPHGWTYKGDGWSGWDFERTDGCRLELKQSAAKQTWSQPRSAQTRGAFDIAARKGYFYEGGAKWAPTPGRCAQIYVFAWHPIFGPEADHRNPDQWEFYVVPATSLPDGRRTIGRTGIKKLTVPVKLEELGGAVQSLAVVGPPDNGARTPLV
jgi:hypothetical protein